MAIALHHSRAKGTAKLVLLGIANHDGDGGAWPALATLAHYAGVDIRNARRAIERLEQLGEIRRDVQAGGDHRTPDHRRPNRYRFLLECPPNCDRTRNHRTRHHELVPEYEVDPRAVAPAPGGSARGPRAAAPAEPSTNPPCTDISDNDEYVSRAGGLPPQCWKGHPLLDGAEVCIFGHYSPEREQVRLEELVQEAQR